MSPDFKFWPGKDPRYAALGIKDEDIPVSESLKDVTKRTSPRDAPALDVLRRPQYLPRDVSIKTMLVLVCVPSQGRLSAKI